VSLDAGQALRPVTRLANRPGLQARPWEKFQGLLVSAPQTTTRPSGRVVFSAGQAAAQPATAIWYSRVERAPERQNISTGVGNSRSSAARAAASSGDW